jgi:hypothetical protein
MVADLTGEDERAFRHLLVVAEQVMALDPGQPNLSNLR